MTAKRKRAAARALSELEGCVLGELWKHGASTAYAIRRVFLASPSSHWSGSAGAVYPVLERLESAGLVESVPAPRGGRKAWAYSLTALGRRRFRAWLEPPFRPEIISIPPDPLRTRLSFFSALSTARRARFLQLALAALKRERQRFPGPSESDPDEARVQRVASRAVDERIATFELLKRELSRS